ncbi:MAG: Gfo/Idh/MocA family oxidoreductase [Spirochaetaceae bacterium]|jgi:predicted dehydrogenase|nr:Gfo/Idh/MocA family oxidoreductase [Spirochaetaceae bacterium]
MNDSLLNIGIIGTGSISRLHIEAYLAFPHRCRIAAFCDSAPEKADEYKRKYVLDTVAVYDSVEGLLAAVKKGDISLDLVSICTPPFRHAETAVACLKAGINILVEKPMAASLEECDAMLAAEKESGKVLASVAQNRFHDPIAILKKTLDSSLAGRVLHAQADSFWWRGFHYYDLWWRGKWETEGGGCTLNHAVHHIDMLIWMMGLPEKVTAVLTNAAHSNAEVEDLSVAVLQYPRGALAQITSSVIHHGEEQKLVFQCEKARVSAPWKVHAAAAGPNAFPLKEHNEALERELNGIAAAWKPLDYTAHTGQIEQLLTTLESGESPAITGRDGRNTIELVSAIYKAGASESAVKLPLEKDDPFYTVKGIMAAVPHFYEKSLSAKDLAGNITTGSRYQ